MYVFDNRLYSFIFWIIYLCHYQHSAIHAFMNLLIFSLNHMRQNNLLRNMHKEDAHNMPHPLYVLCICIILCEFQEGKLKYFLKKIKGKWLKKNDIFWGTVNSRMKIWALENIYKSIIFSSRWILVLKSRFWEQIKTDMAMWTIHVHCSYIMVYVFNMSFFPFLFFELSKTWGALIMQIEPR